MRSSYSYDILLCTRHAGSTMASWCRPRSRGFESRTRGPRIDQSETQNHLCICNKVNNSGARKRNPHSPIKSSPTHYGLPYNSLRWKTAQYNIECLLVEYVHMTPNIYINCLENIVCCFQIYTLPFIYLFIYYTLRANGITEGSG